MRVNPFNENYKLNKLWLIFDRMLKMEEIVTVRSLTLFLFHP